MTLPESAAGSSHENQRFHETNADQKNGTASSRFKQ